MVFRKRRNALSHMRISKIVIEQEYQATVIEEDWASSLSDNELLIETEVSFISAGTELSIFTGAEPKTRQAGTWPAYPHDAGYANVGRVLALGKGVKHFSEGDRVFSYGPHASHFRYPVNKMLVKAPENVEASVLAASRMVGVGLTAPLLADVRYGPTVAIFGLGAVGNCAAQGFKAMGCNVLAFDPLEGRRSTARACGLVASDVEKEVMEASLLRQFNHTQVDIVVDSTGLSQVIDDAMAYVAPFGQCFLLGSPRASLNADITAFFSKVHLNSIRVQGAFEWNVPHYPQKGRRDSLLEKQKLIFQWMLDGRLNLKPLVSHEVLPHEIQSAYEGLLQQPDEYIGVAIRWDKK